MADFYNTKGDFKSKKGVIFNSLAVEHYLLFGFVNAISSKTHDLIIQTDFNLRIEGKKINFKIFNRSHYMKKGDNFLKKLRRWGVLQDNLV